ncbi:hypothetical protein [Curtobacterium sp. MCPF17_052]|uniref:hypothetical protein n=1 Tax=Curtobacterium sp. MCPF17_052 TaxID=2175655 RepID=UPI0011B65335|nr:hypothetical protein [Curtobacterium sp. MCPF17_052]WIB13320.1 hypothetical protein DEJ36_05600 [Curtobacterium sp. MCPF17_052]
MTPITNATRHITIELPTRTATLLTAISVHKGMTVADYMVAAAVSGARTIIDNDLAGKRRNERWQFVDERWLRRHAGRVHRHLRRGRQFIVTPHGDPVGYLLHPNAGAEASIMSPRPRRRRHP